MNEDSFIRELYETFKIEADEHVKKIDEGLLSLEKNFDQKIVEDIFRDAHSLKGAARAVNKNDIQSICQELETVFSEWKSGKIEIPPSEFNLLYATLDLVKQSLEERDVTLEMERIISSLKEVADGKKVTFTAPVVKNAPQKHDASTVRLPVQKLEELTQQIEELFSIKYLTRERFRSLPGSTQITQDLYTIDHIIDQIVENSKKLLLQPLTFITDHFSRMVRDLAVSLGKEVNFKVVEGDVEIDLRIIENLKDPLMHLIRNSIDHGIESPAERLSQGKPAAGTLLIEVVPISGKEVQINVSDDGRGIDPKTIKGAALNKGLITKFEHDEMSEDEAIHLIFRSGFSLSQQVTEISGRGLGMEIVLKKIEEIGGRLKIQSTVGKGTTFSMLLPITLSNTRGIQLRAGMQDFILPVNHVNRIVRLHKKDLIHFEDKLSVMLDGRHYAFSYLADILQLPHPSKENFPGIVIQSATLNYVIGVDEILKEHEILVKSLGQQIKKLKYFSGASILEGGTALPILDSNDLIEPTSHHAQEIVQEEATEAKTPLILIVEDSLTSRQLLKHIVESQGYQALTANDGMDGLAVLQQRHVDLVISDVEMPRMDGWELTTKIRSDDKLHHLPVILCTSRGSQEDRERGLKAGANAYLDKSSFEQKQLIELIKQLL